MKHKTGEIQAIITNVVVVKIKPGSTEVAESVHYSHRCSCLEYTQLFLLRNIGYKERHEIQNVYSVYLRVPFFTPLMISKM